MEYEISTKILRGVITMFRKIVYALGLICLLTGTILANSTRGQVRLSMEKINISLDMENAKVRDIFASIEDQTSFTFSYFTSKLNDRVSLTIDAENESLANVLRQISRKAGFKFKRVNEKIYVVKKKRFDKGVEEILEEYDQISGKVTSYDDGESLAGVNVIISKWLGKELPP